MGVYDWTGEKIHSRPVYHGGNGSQYLYFAYNGAWMIDTNRHGIAGEVGAHDSSTCPTDVASDHWLAKNGTHWSDGSASNGTHWVIRLAFSLNVTCVPRVEPPTQPPSPPSICLRRCAYSNDGNCDDGGPGAQYALCDLGSDCDDCGLRPIVAPPPPPPAAPMVQSEISVTNDDYNSEVSWQLTCDGLFAPITGGAPHLGSMQHPECNRACGASGWSSTGAGAVEGSCHNCWQTGYLSNCPSGTHHRADGWIRDECCNKYNCTSSTWRVPLGTCTLRLSDSYGDGWQGAIWTAPGWTDQSYTLASGSSETFSFSVSYQPPSPPPLPPPPPQSPPPPPAMPVPSEVSVTD